MTYKTLAGSAGLQFLTVPRSECLADRCRGSPQRNFSEEISTAQGPTPAIHTLLVQLSRARLNPTLLKIKCSKLG